MDGVGSEEDQSGSLYPIPVSSPRVGVPVVRSYCPIDATGQETGWPAGLDLGLRRWAEFTVPGGSSGGSSAPDSSQVCELSGGFATKSCLLARLADAGAVVLPYSYVGAQMTPEPSGAVFDFQGYSASDSKQSIDASTASLQTELSSIHQVWPVTHIVVVAHSWGGAVAEQWWEQDRPADADHLNVSRVFTLDSPINGGRNCTRLGVHLLGLGHAVSQWMCDAWKNLATRDSGIVAANTDNSLTVVGTPNDPTYADSGLGGIDALKSAGGGLEAQVVSRCWNGSDDVMPQDANCIDSPPSFPSTDTACNGATGDIYGTIRHDLVKACPAVVTMIVQAVKDAAIASRQIVLATSTTVSPGTSTTLPPSPTTTTTPPECGTSDDGSTLCITGVKVGDLGEFASLDAGEPYLQITTSFDYEGSSQLSFPFGVSDDFSLIDDATHTVISSGSNGGVSDACFLSVDPNCTPDPPTMVAGAHVTMTIAYGFQTPESRNFLSDPLSLEFNDNFSSPVDISIPQQHV
jgi:hypothetical protein